MTQVEAVILQHPGISRVIVVGLPDNRFTEMVVACIQLQENWQWTDADSLKLINKKDHCLCAEILQQFCKDKNLTRYLFMYLVTSLSSFPRSLIWQKMFIGISILHFFTQAKRTHLACTLTFYIFSPILYSRILFYFFIFTYFMHFKSII